MRVVHVTPYYAPAYAFGGVARACEGLCAALVARGHAVTVLTTDAHTQTTRSPAPRDELRDGVRVLRARNLSVTLRGKANLSTPTGWGEAGTTALREADVVHCHEFRTAENLLLTPGIARRRARLVLSPHGTLAHATGRSTLKRAWDALLSPAVARRFDVVLGLTQHEADEAAALWADFGANAQFTVAPNGVDPAAFANLPGAADFRAAWGLRPGPVVLFMGRLHPRKGAVVLAEAFRQVRIADANLVIAGPDEGDRQALARLAADDPRITLTGYLDGAARLGALAAADLFALPAVGEGLPLTVLEAMAAGVAVVISPGCHLPEVEPAGAGRVAPVDAAALAAALAGLLADDTARTRMAHAARALVHKRFTWVAVAARVTAIYEA
jgi:glycosyltransferase involved in cell wall biosynthesis